ncbi:MAG: hypothetical protein Q8K04_03160 [Lutibacter sp.]|nr:hypothetical protein [Lutibacter sp.]
MLFFKKPYDVVFYYPQHFNRSEKGTNPFFDPFIKMCEKHHLKYLVIEEPDRNTSVTRSKKAFQFDFWFYIIILLRKMLPLFLFTAMEQRDEFIGKIVSVISMNFFKANCYITISNSMINVLLGLNANSKVYDLQHGIIYSWHWGYFNQKGELNNNLRNNRIRFLVNGNGFKEIFYKNNPFLKLNEDAKVVVTGNSEVILNSSDSSIVKNNVLYTLQLTADLNENELLEEKNKLKSFLVKTQNSFVSNGLQLLLKSHPRFNNAIDLSDILKSYPFVKFTNDTIEKLTENTMLHITQSSTSIFEFALAGIPTYIIPNAIGNKIFLEEFNYPNENLELEDIILIYNTKNQKYFEFCLRVKKWALNYYEPLNEIAIIDLIHHGKN